MILLWAIMATVLAIFLYWCYRDECSTCDNYRINEKIWRERYWEDHKEEMYIKEGD